MKKTDLAKAAGLTPTTLARLSKDEIVSMKQLLGFVNVYNVELKM